MTGLHLVLAARRLFGSPCFFQLGCDSSASRAPAEGIETNRFSNGEPHPFALETQTLYGSPGATTSAEADPALSVDHTVPRNPAVDADRAQGITDETSLARQPREPRHLAVGRDPASRDPGHHRVDTFVTVAGAGHEIENTLDGPRIDRPDTARDSADPHRPPLILAASPGEIGALD